MEPLGSGRYWLSLRGWGFFWLFACFLFFFSFCFVLPTQKPGYTYLPAKEDNREAFFLSFFFFFALVSFFSGLARINS